MSGDGDEKKGELRDILEYLTASEAEALKARLRGNDSLKETARRFDTSRERMRAIERKALRKLGVTEGEDEGNGPDGGA